MSELRAILSYVDNRRGLMLSIVIGVAIFSSLFVQSEVVCRCWKGSFAANRGFASLVLDLIAIGRGVIAFILREKNPPWLAYSLACVTSPLWVSPIFKGAILFHDATTGDTLWPDLELSHSH